MRTLARFVRFVLISAGDCALGFVLLTLYFRAVG